MRWRSTKGNCYDAGPESLITSAVFSPREKPSSAIDNLDRAERLGLLNSADEWMTMRSLRNQMVHEYVEDPVVPSSALQTGHAFVPILIEIPQGMIAEVKRRGLGMTQY